MPVSGVDHVNIRTTDIDAAVAFYVDVLGFRHTRGPVVMGNQANWLHDAAGAPIIHLRLRAAEAGTGAVDHVALRCTDRAGMVARLEAHAVRFDVANVQPGLTQVFVRDPHGVMLELNFTGE